MKNYDLVIIGSGPAGILAAKIAVAKKMSVLIIEKGKDLIHRKDIVSGWFGHALFSFDRLELVDSKLNSSFYVRESLRLLEKIIGNSFETIKSNGVKYCIFPLDSGKKVATYFLNLISTDVDMLFNSEVESIVGDSEGFIVKTTKKEFGCKRCLIATGKYSIDWIKYISSALKLETLSMPIKVGVRVELPNTKIKDISFICESVKANCDCNVICNDTHFDSFVGEWEESDILSAGNCNIPEKKSGKVNFMVGLQTEAVDDVIRTVKIANVLSNDKLKIERVSEYMEGKSVLEHLSIFDSLYDTFYCLDGAFPAFINSAIMYVPEVSFQGILKVDEKMKTAIPNLYAAGECTTKVSTTLGAIASGIIAAKTMLKE
jgi:hypothetical protein